MDMDELMNMKLVDVLERFCIVYSPECDYYYGITEWDDALQMLIEYKLDDEYCFAADSLIPMDYGVESGEEVLSIDDLRHILDYLGIEKKETNEDDIDD